MSSQRIIKRLSFPQQSIEQVQTNDNALARIFVPEGNDVPLVECTKSGDVITQIDIRCSCGQVTRLVCEYPKNG